MASDNTALSLIEGKEISSVVFARGYVQLLFDGPYLNAYVWPSIIDGGRRITAKQPGYRDALCDQIGKEVTTAIEKPSEKLALQFADGTALEISLLEEDRSGPEAAMLQDEGGKRWEVW